MTDKEKEIEFNIFISEFLGQELSPFELAKEAFIYFQNRTCESCKFYEKTTQKNHICNLNHDIWHLDRGCEQWES